MSDLSKQLILGVEGGATKTDWVLCESEADGLKIVSQGQLGVGSMKLLDAAGLRHLLEVLPRDVDRVGLFLAGCATSRDRETLSKLAAEVWPRATIHAGSDRESGYAAAFGRGDGIAVIAGTGSAVTGRHGEHEERAGGWGHLLGDTGGGYDLSIRALRRILFDFDTGQHLTRLASGTLHTLGLNTLRELTDWAQTARKSDLARLTPLLFRDADEPESRAIIANCARALAQLTSAVASRLGFTAPPVRLMGGVFARQPLYRELFAEAFRAEWPQADIALCEEPGSFGAAFLATGRAPQIQPVEERLPDLAAAPTEQSNPRSENLSSLTPAELVTLFATEEHYVELALRLAIPELTRAVEIVSDALREGGRLFYVGAGTSGRLGMLDASEMPPTFGVEPTLIQAIMAGGAAAFQKSAEGAEDSRAGGAQAVLDRGVRSTDVVCGIAASGRTPFVLGALEQARRLGAATVFLTCNPQRPKDTPVAQVEIDLSTGPEIITGSTRLKAGTATKVALNIISSCAMIRLGRVEGNLMACLQPTNAKLRDRATRIVATRLAISSETAQHLLECANWNIQAALRAAREKPTTSPNPASPSLLER